MKLYNEISTPKLLTTVKEWTLGKHENENKKAKDSGIYFGKLNIPKADEPVNTYIQSIVNAYAHIWHDGKQRLDNLTNTLESSVESLKTREEQIEESTRPIGQKIALLESDLLQHKVNYPWVMFVIYLLCLALLILAETFYNGKVFQLLGQNLIITTALAFSITFGLLVSYYQRNKLRVHIKNPILKVLIEILWIIVFTVFFYLLAEYRNVYATTTGNDEEFSVPLFVLINWALLIASEFFLLRLPNTATVKAIFSKRAIIRKIKALNLQAFELIEELDAVETSIVGLERDMMNMGSEEHNLRNLIEASLNQSVSDFFHENRRYRTDGNCPTGGYTQNENFLNI